jgi:hypothetical protein
MPDSRQHRDRGTVHGRKRLLALQHRSVGRAVEIDDVRACRVGYAEYPARTWRPARRCRNLLLLVRSLYCACGVLAGGERAAPRWRFIAEGCAHIGDAFWQVSCAG